MKKITGFGSLVKGFIHNFINFLPILLSSTIGSSVCSALDVLSTDLRPVTCGTFEKLYEGSGNDFEARIAEILNGNSRNGYFG